MLSLLIVYCILLLHLSAWCFRFGSHSEASFVIPQFRLSHPPWGFSHLVVQAVFKLAPCCPLPEFQVNQREFSFRPYLKAANINGLHASTNQFPYHLHALQNAHLLAVQAFCYFQPFGLLTNFCWRGWFFDLPSAASWVIPLFRLSHHPLGCPLT